MAQVSSAADIKSLGTIMMIWAHPDDESFTSAGVSLAAIQYGQDVICVTATKGEQGLQDPHNWSLEGLGDTRAKELQSALDILGIKQHYWLDYEDGCCEQANREEAAEKLAELITKHQPDTILTFGKDGMTGHSDHCCVSCWVDDAVELSDTNLEIFHAVTVAGLYESHLKKMDEKLNIFFNINEPVLKDPEQCDIYLELSDAHKDIKCDALRAMPSQTGVIFDAFDETFIKEALSVEAFVRAK